MKLMLWLWNCDVLTILPDLSPLKQSQNEPNMQTFSPNSGLIVLYRPTS